MIPRSTAKLAQPQARKDPALEQIADLGCLLEVCKQQAGCFRTLKTLRRAAEQLRKKTQNPSSRQRRTRRSKNFGSRTRAALSTAVDHIPNASV